MKKQISIVYKRGLLWKHQQQSYYLKLISLDNRQKINTNVVWHQTFHQSFKLKTGKNIWCSVESNSNQIEYWPLDHLPKVLEKHSSERLPNSNLPVKPNSDLGDSWKKNLNSNQKMFGFSSSLNSGIGNMIRNFQIHP